jgi:nucleoside 2-deoxyribosyltransferase
MTDITQQTGLRIYLAGPEVFHPNAHAIADA